MKRIGKTLLNILVLTSMIIAIAYLLHDFFVLGILPAFSHNFYCITYFGLLTDLGAYMVIKGASMYFEELFK